MLTVCIHGVILQMTLREYIKQYQKSVRVFVRQSVADELGVTYRALLAYEFGQRQIRPELLMKLEDITNGLVTLKEMRPDIVAERMSLKKEIRKVKLKLNNLETTQPY